MKLEGIKYLFYIVIPFFVVFAVSQYFMVIANEFNSNGVAYFVYSSPIQGILLLGWSKYKGYSFKQVLLLVVMFGLIAFLAHLALWFIYFGAGGRW